MRSQPRLPPAPCSPPRGPRAPAPQRVPSARLRMSGGSPDGLSAAARASLRTDCLLTGAAAGQAGPRPPPTAAVRTGIQIPIPSPPGAARPRQQRLPRHGTCCRPAVAAPRRRLAAVGGRCGGWRLGLCAGLCAGPQRCLRTDSSGAAAAAGARAGEGGSGTRGPGAESVTGGGPGGGRERGRGGGGGAMGLGDAATASSGSASGRRGRSVSTGTGRGRGEMRRCEKAGLGAPLPSREERVLATGTVGLCSSHSPRQRLRRQREAGAAPCAAPLPAQAAGGSTGGVTGR